MLQRDTPLEELADRIPGTASRKLKLALLQNFNVTAWDKSLFASSVGRELDVVEISYNEKAEEPKKLEARLVCEMNVTQGTLLCT